MHTAQVREIKLVPIGNSMGIRLPKTILLKYGLSGQLVLEEKKEGVLIRSPKSKQLSWEQTYQTMVKEKENWTDFEGVLTDGLEEDDFNT